MTSHGKGLAKTNEDGGLPIRTDAGDRVLAFDFPAFRVGIAEYPDGPTGTTVLHSPDGATAALDVRGGSPGVIGDYGFVHAIALAGGSLLGLEAASGVAAGLLARGGYRARSSGPSRRPAKDDEPDRILVVDDDPRTLRLVRDALSAEGYAPVVTGDHHELARILRAERPVLAVLDLVLPCADGIELMGQIAELSDLPVIFISAYGRDETVARALDAGAADYIVKPFSPTELTARVRGGAQLHGTGDPAVPHPRRRRCPVGGVDPRSESLAVVAERARRRGSGSGVGRGARSPSISLCPRPSNSSPPLPPSACGPGPACW